MFLHYLGLHKLNPFREACNSEAWLREQIIILDAVHHHRLGWWHYQLVAFAMMPSHGTDGIFLSMAWNIVGSMDYTNPWRSFIAETRLR